MSLYCWSMKGWSARVSKETGVLYTGTIKLSMGFSTYRCDA